MKECPECFSDKARVTPIMDPESCLRSHTQYVCGTCGRCICIDIDKLGKPRARLPFKALAIAKYYLRAAEVINRAACGIYEILDDRKNRFFMICANKTELTQLIKANPGWSLPSNKAVHSSPGYRDCRPKQVRKLTASEITRYLAEQKSMQEA